MRRVMLVMQVLACTLLLAGCALKFDRAAVSPPDVSEEPDVVDTAPDPVDEPDLPDDPGIEDLREEDPAAEDAPLEDPVDPFEPLEHVSADLAVYVAGCPGLSYLKDARFVAPKLKEQYPVLQRRVINALAIKSGTPRLVELSSPVVEAGIFDSDKGTALVLGNFTYKPIAGLTVRVPVARDVKAVRSAENGALKFRLVNASKRLKDAGFTKVAVFTTKLGLSDIIVLE